MTEAQGDADAPDHEQPPAENRSKESAEVGKAMDSLADGGTEQAMDSSKADAAVAKLEEQRAQDAEASRKRAAELAKVTVSKDDVKLVATEFDLTTKVADTKLREHNGDLKATLRSLLNEGLPTPA